MDGSQKMVLISSSGDGERMQFSSSSAKNDLRHKRFDILNSNKKWGEMVLRLCDLILFQFPMGTYLLEMNK
jgi:hypothetical protein